MSFARGSPARQDHPASGRPAPAPDPRHNAGVDQEPAPSTDARPTVLHVRVHGIVQGVGYRHSMRAMAARLHLDGWVRNCRDGTVEAVVSGDAQAIDAMLHWCRRGPPDAAVERVDTRAGTDAEAAALQAGFRHAPTV
jgi:acylphosphatase